MKAITKDELYKITGWASWDCKTLVNNLADYGLIVVNRDDFVELVSSLKQAEDDGK